MGKPQKTAKKKKGEKSRRTDRIQRKNYKSVLWEMFWNGKIGISVEGIRCLEWGGGRTGSLGCARIVSNPGVAKSD